MATPKPNYSKNQQSFIRKCKSSGLNLYYNYSGRGMFGDTCPAVNVDNLSDFPGNPHKYKIDNMGMGFVVYAQN